MIISIKDKIIDIIYRIKNRGLLLDSYDFDFYELPIYLNDFESGDNND